MTKTPIAKTSQDEEASGQAPAQAGSPATAESGASPLAKQGTNALRIGIAGYGAIGQRLAASLTAGIPGIALTALASRDTERLRAALPRDFGVRAVPVAELCRHADVIIECAPAAALPSIAIPALEA